MAKTNEPTAPPSEGAPAIKQAAVTGANLPSDPAHIRVSGLSGALGAIVFDDNGLSTRPVTDAEADEVRRMFPNAEVIAQKKAENGGE